MRAREDTSIFEEQNLPIQEKIEEKRTHRQELAQYCFAVMNGLSRRTKRRLLQSYEEEEILTFSEGEWQSLLTAREWTSYCRNKNSYNIEETEKQWEHMRQKNVNFVYWKEEKFPQKLRQIPDCPLGLFYKGNLPKDEPSIGIVGSRTPSPYGKEMAAYFARELAWEGITVISGLAYGIDVAAHKGALEAGGITYGVLGCGPDMVYPKENFSIYEKMEENGGILSEYSPGTIPASFRFPERNRIISGLSDGVLVVEARERSGSLITADQALEQGKEVFAIPGRATDPLSDGTNWLIREGGRLVTKPSQILEELFHLCEQKVKKSLTEEKLLDKKEKVVYDCLSLDPKNIEEIINRTNYSVSDVISILFRLELNGYVNQIVKDYYIKTIR